MTNKQGTFNLRRPMKIFDLYLFRNLLIATTLTATTLTAIVFLTQSLQFLELVIDSGASASSFWLLTLLAIPRFLEILLPIALMAATVFIYNRMTMDSELVVMRAVGAAPLGLAKPALILAVAVTGMLWFISLWLAPVTESNMDTLRDEIKSQYSSLLFQEGTFNQVRPGIMVFVRDRLANGDMHGILIYDTRKKNSPPVTVVAKRGEIVDDRDGQHILVYDGSRQGIDDKTGNLARLDFDRYAIDLPSDNGPTRDRWREAGERSFDELFNPNTGDPRDVKAARAFVVEAHRRIISPLLAPSYAIIGMACLLLGSVDRRGQGWRIILAILTVTAVQAGYMAAFSLARQSPAGLVLMYVAVFAPLAAGGFALVFGADLIQRRRGGTQSGQPRAAA